MEVNVLIEEGFEKYLEAGWLQKVAEQTLIAERAGAEVELGIVVTGQEQLHALNRDYLGENRPTDVLSFSAREGEEPFVMPPDGVTHLGEVIISYPQAVIQAGEHQYPVSREITTLLVHGLLHLLGYDHDTPELEQKMFSRAADILSEIEGANR